MTGDMASGPELTFSLEVHQVEFRAPGPEGGFCVAARTILSRDIALAKEGEKGFIELNSGEKLHGQVRFVRPQKVNQGTGTPEGRDFPRHESESEEGECTSGRYPDATPICGCDIYQTCAVCRPPFTPTAISRLAPGSQFVDEQEVEYTVAGHDKALGRSSCANKCGAHFWFDSNRVVQPTYVLTVVAETPKLKAQDGPPALPKMSLLSLLPGSQFEFEGHTYTVPEGMEPDTNAVCLRKDVPEGEEIWKPIGVAELVQPTLIFTHDCTKAGLPGWSWVRDPLEAKEPSFGKEVIASLREHLDGDKPLCSGCDCLRGGCDCDGKDGRPLCPDRLLGDDSVPEGFSQRVTDLVRNRGSDYGNPAENHQLTADMWSVWLSRRLRQDIKLSAEDVCMLNVLQKQSRLAFRTKDDSWFDVAGYTENVAMLRPEQRNT
jgi:hypothetical protein